MLRSASRLTTPLRTRAVASRHIYIRAETTPNPQSMKFLPDAPVLPAEFGTGMHFDATNLRQVKRSPLVKSIFETPGLKSAYLGPDFISVTKDDDSSWNRIKPQVFSSILDFYSKEQPVVLSGDDDAPSNDTMILDTDSEVVAAIKELMETRVRPSVQDDGGDILYMGFDTETGIVKVKLAGSCVGCPSSSITLRNGVENMLMHYIPEVRGILEVTEGVPEGDSITDDSELKLKFAPQPSK